MRAFVNLRPVSAVMCDVLIRISVTCVWIVVLLFAAETSLGGDGAQVREPGERAEFMIGADISWVQQQEERGVRFSDNGSEKDVLEILKDHGFNWIRLRIFNDPKAAKGYSAAGYCDLDHTIKMARRIKGAGMKFLLDFHYSDTWADPGHQRKPHGWREMDFEELTGAVHDYTKNVVTELKKHRVSPEMVQIGNEISNGFLWPDGKLSDMGKFTTLIKAGVTAVRQADPSAKIMLHVAWGGQNEKSRWFMDEMLARGVEFDILGQSYYPKWHGSVEDLRKNLKDLAGRYKQPVIVVEYSEHKRQVNDIVHDLAEGKGLGTFIWEPTKWGEAFFDRNGATLPLIDLYAQMAEDYRKN